MPPLGRLKQRCRQPEIMDQPDLAEDQHRQALDGLARINWISASSLMMWPAVRRLCDERRQAGDPKPVRVLDVATGGGDVPIRMWRRARRKGISLEVAGCDFSPVAIAKAESRARAQGAEVHFFARNVLAEGLPDGYDVITCCLFLHHLDEPQVIQLLTEMKRTAQSLAIVNDLTRGLGGWWLAFIGARLLSRSPVVHFDGPLSVEGAFTMTEALELAHKAGWDNAKIRWRWPFRYLMTWSRP